MNILDKVFFRKKRKLINETWNSKENKELYKNARLRISPERAFVIQNFVKFSKHLQGSVIEMGVYKGSTAYLIASEIENSNKSFFICDTFEGTPKEGALDNIKREGLYNDTSLPEVKKYLSQFGFIEYISGYIPNSLDVIKEEVFSFVHIHLNLYESTKNGLEFAYDRLVDYGIILIEDYGLISCEGSKKATDEFAHNNNLEVIYLPTGQGIIFKR